MSLISSVAGGLGGTSTQSSESYGSWGGGTGNSGAMATEFNREMMERSMQYNAEQAAIAREHSALEAEKQRAWTKDMSDTAYQRAVEDLKKAGLNPILAASRGGAEVGQGAMAGAISAGAGAASGVTDTNQGGENWSMMSGYSYSNLADFMQNAGGIIQNVAQGMTNKFISPTQMSSANKVLQNISNFISDRTAGIIRIQRSVQSEVNYNRARSTLRK